jgi:hypothetical protein
MYSRISSVPKISFGSKSRLRAKEGESWDCNREQQKRIEKKDYSWIVCFFDAALFSSTGCFPLSTMALGVFSLEKQDERSWNDGSACEWTSRAPRGLFY